MLTFYIYKFIFIIFYEYFNIFYKYYKFKINKHFTLNIDLHIKIKKQL